VISVGRRGSTRPEFSDTEKIGQAADRRAKVTLDEVERILV